MSAEQAFDKYAQDYDASRRQLIPCFNDFYGTAVELIDFDCSKPLRVLDLGAGTGLFAGMIAGKYPNAEYTLCDVSSKMLEQAKQRFAGSALNIKYVVSDYASEEIDGGYDLIISALSIHHLSGEEKQSLFRKLHASLTGGGLFVNADQVLGRTPDVEEAYKAAWLRKVKANGASDETLAAALERMKEDQMSTLDEQLGWLEQAGFSDVNCWYKNYSFVVFSGRR